MVKKMIVFDLPEAHFAFTHTKVYRSTTGSGGPWTELTVTDDPHYTANGIPISYDYAIDNYGGNLYYWRLRFYDSINNVYSDYSLPMTLSMRGYCTVEDVRDFTNIQEAEYSDNALQARIDQATAMIDMQTGRTWQGVQTTTDELRDGDGTTSLIMTQGDIGAVSKLAVWDGGQYTTLASTAYTVLQFEGIIQLNLLPSGLIYNIFPKKRKIILMSYTWGNAVPDDKVKMLCILEVANMLKRDQVRSANIEELKTYLSRNAMTSLS